MTAQVSTPALADARELDLPAYERALATLAASQMITQRTAP